MKIFVRTLIIATMALVCVYGVGFRMLAADVEEITVVGEDHGAPEDTAASTTGQNGIDVDNSVSAESGVTEGSEGSGEATETTKGNAASGAGNIDDNNIEPDRSDGGEIDGGESSEPRVDIDIEDGGQHEKDMTVANGTMEGDIAAIRSYIEFVLFECVPFAVAVGLIVLGCWWFYGTFIGPAFRS